MATFGRIGRVAFCLGLSACGVAAGGGPDDPERTDPSVATTAAALETLVPLADCGETEAYVREAALASMNRDIDARLTELDRMLETSRADAKYCYGYGGYPGSAMDAGTASNAGGAGSPSAGSPAPAPPSASTGASGEGDAAKSASGTNNQVSGVDEADFIKNDTKYVYAAMNGALRIVDAWPPELAHEVSRTPITGDVKKLFVEGDRALVYVAEARPGTNNPSSGAYVPTTGRECTYGYDCSFGGDGTATKLMVFDIANKAAPVKVREVWVSGSLIAARRIGAAVHTVFASPSIAFGNLQTYASVPCGSEAMTYREYVKRARDQYAILRVKNAAIIRSTPIRDLFPSIKDGTNELSAACGGFFRSALADGASFTTVLSLDMVHDGAPTMATVVSRPGAVYASGTALYMAVTHQRAGQSAWYGGDFATATEASTVHRFRIGDTPGLTGYEASGSVKGHVLNQFGMDERDGLLRIATTIGKVPSPDVSSSLTVLERAGQRLVRTGGVDGIAPTEDIRSVRFDGDRGFVVTFKKTDPLFVVDFADARQPKMMGELKIPGFSTYMHMMDRDHLLTIGYDADDKGSFAFFNGVILQIFDVSNPSAPTLAHKHVIGTRGSSSEALTNHLAFNYFAPKNLLAIPMTVCEGGGNGQYGTNMTFSGLMVFDVTTAGGFQEHGRVAHPPKNGSTNGGYNNAACQTWWTNAQSEVKRSVILDDYVLSVSDEVMKASALSHLGSPVSEVSLAQ